jgi:hypothetical protein
MIGLFGHNLEELAPPDTSAQYQDPRAGSPNIPAGRPARGANAEALSANDAHEIIRAAIDKAKDGDIAAVRLCLDRIAPRPMRLSQWRPALTGA